MSETKKLVVMITTGLDDERSSVAFSVANGGITAGLEVTAFLTSNGVDWARKGAAERSHPNPFDPSMKEMLQSFMDRGGKILVCPPCAEVRGYSQENLLDGVILIGSKAMHELIKEGAATLSF